jgi:hypothetical protein
MLFIARQHIDLRGLQSGEQLSADGAFVLPLQVVRGRLARVVWQQADGLKAAQCVGEQVELGWGGEGVGTKDDVDVLLWGDELELVSAGLDCGGKGAHLMDDERLGVEYVEVAFELELLGFWPMPCELSEVERALQVCEADGCEGSVGLDQARGSEKGVAQDADAGVGGRCLEVSVEGLLAVGEGEAQAWVLGPDAMSGGGWGALGVAK